MLGALRRCPTSLRWSIVSQANARSIATSVHFTARTRPAITSQRIQSLAAFRTFHHASVYKQSAVAIEREIEANVAAEEPPSAEEIELATQTGEITRFQELADRDLVAKRVIANITQGMGIETMTQVQSMTINEAIKGRDVLAQARTGTGKTLGFLLPILQNILAEDPSLESRQPPSRDSYADRSQDIRAIIISPTRELAEQIAVEAEKLVRGTGVKVQRAVGGTQKNMHSRKIRQEGCHILVGTPGRLNDLLTDETSGLRAPKLSAFVLDEADRLMDEGFWPEIQRIQQALPTRAQRDRQTLMFSATMPENIIKLVRGTMKPDLHFVRTVQENEEPTHERVPQKLAVVPGLENQLPALLELCERQISTSKPFKAIIYFQSTAEVVLASSIFFRLRRAAVAGQSNTLGPDTRIYEIHGKLTQASRTKSADNFRKCTNGILMSTDVTARGLDFPNVSHVIQIGLPKDRDTYVHRLGRTARAGLEGEGWLIMPSTNLNEARVRLGKLPIKRDHSLETAKISFPSSTGDPQESAAEPDMADSTAHFFAQVKNAASEVPQDQRDDVYMAMLGTMTWMQDKQRLVEMMNRLASVQWGMQKPPSIGAGIASKLRLMSVPGLNIRARDDYERSREPSGGRRGSGASRGGSRGSFGGERSSGRSFNDSRGSFGDERNSGRSYGGERSSFGGDRRPERFDNSRGSFSGGERRFNREGSGGSSSGRGGFSRGSGRDGERGGRSRNNFRESY